MVSVVGNVKYWNLAKTFVSGRVEYTAMARKIESDSTADGVTYKKLYCSADSEISEWNFEAPVREQDGKVWVVADGKENLLHDFAVNGNWLYGDRLCFATYKKRGCLTSLGGLFFMMGQ